MKNNYIRLVAGKIERRGDGYVVTGIHSLFNAFRRGLNVGNVMCHENYFDGKSFAEYSWQAKSYDSVAEAVEQVSASFPALRIATRHLGILKLDLR